MSDGGLVLGPGESFDPRPTLWRTTLAGNALPKARIEKPIPCAKASALLDDLLDRVRPVKDEPDWLHWVERVTLYGSMMQPDRPHVGDVDVVVHLTDRYDRQVPRSAAGDDRTRRRLASIDQIGYAELKLLRHLRGRSGRIDLDLAHGRERLPPGAVSAVVYERRGS